MGQKPSEKDLQRFEQRLRELHAELTSDLQKLEVDALGDREKPAERQGDEGVEATGEFLDLDLLALDESRLRAVVDALERVKEGTYGRCETCGEWIEGERLAEVPEARECALCARRREEARAT